MDLSHYKDRQDRVPLERIDSMPRDGHNDEGYGFLFPVAPEKKRDNGPSMSGKATLNGRECQVAAWTKTAKNSGAKYLSLKFQEYEVSGAAVPEAPDDDLPF